MSDYEARILCKYAGSLGTVEKRRYNILSRQTPELLFNRLLYLNSDKVKDFRPKFSMLLFQAQFAQLSPEQA
jgi:hypothetical protein